VSLHNLELFFEVGSQVQPLLIRGRLKRRSPERLLDVVRVVELEAMPRLEPLPVLKGRIPEGWKDAVYAHR
jgi:hypothetical protein